MTKTRFLCLNSKYIIDVCCPAVIFLLIFCCCFKEFYHPKCFQLKISMHLIIYVYLKYYNWLNCKVDLFNHDGTINTFYLLCLSFEFDLGDRTFKVLHIPGHSPGTDIENFHISGLYIVHTIHDTVYFRFDSFNRWDRCFNYRFIFKLKIYILILIADLSDQWYIKW